MAKNLNVSLAFTANTNEAIASIKKLQKELNSLATGSALKDSGISQLTPEIQKAMIAAGELQAKLEAATNLKTGKLDLGQFSDSLKKGGVSLQQYANQLNALGPAGRQAFIDLASSIIQAEAPLIRCSQKVKELGTTLANTARWQISSSILHGFMGTVQSAYGYAQNLNKSLNDIRIVTGASVAEMDRFAAQANKAAKALSTTTNEYAKASLIYFQQGDTQTEAMEKAAVTTKMANVTGQSAEVVSNQLTAIWNNFNKEGDQSYEHFANILTKLGAATASSTDEIAGGLEKFAGIADTIGLSYEYAASALATITATSRESEEVVGTALKTIFARIQGLKQGETLEDGTTLNKYSEALQNVGISIFNQSGELKNMDSILKEMADKWVVLSKDQQLALAQTVAGVRQYNQMVTLMDNWDFMEENLNAVMSAEGELDKQAEIYAESWEAARDRVTASAEAIYSKILDDDFFIGFLDGLSVVIDGVGDLIDAFGGLKGVLLTVGAFATKLFHDELSQGLRNTLHNIKQLTPLGKKEQEKNKQDAMEGLRQLHSDLGGAEGEAENKALEREFSMQQQLKNAASRVTEEDLKQLQIQMDLVRAMDKRAIAAAKALDAAEKELEALQQQNRIRAKMDATTEAREKAKTQIGNDLLDFATSPESDGQTTNVIQQAYERATQEIRSRHNFDSSADISSYQAEINAELVNQIDSVLSDLNLSGTEVGTTINKMIEDGMKSALQKAQPSIDKVGENVDVYQSQIKKAGNLNAQGKTLSNLSNQLASTVLEEVEENGKKNVKVKENELDNVYDQLKTRIDAAAASAKSFNESIDENSEAKGALNDLEQQIQNFDTRLQEAKGNATELAKLLQELNPPEDSDEPALGNIIEEVAQNIGGTGGIIEQEANIGINQPSFDTSGQFEAATNAGLQDIRAQNADADVKAQQDSLNEKFADAGGLEDWADQITNATDLIAGLGSVITSIQGAIDVFNNPDASAWDYISAILSVIMGILPVITSLYSIFGTTATVAGTSAGAAMTAALGPIGIAIIAITAIIALFAVLINRATDAEKALEKAQAATEGMSEAASKAQERYQELLNTITSYDSAIEKMDELTAGTNEFTSALLTANGYAQDLIEKYNLMPDDYYIDENGIIKFNTGVLDEAIENERENVEQSNALLLGAKINQNNAQRDLDISEMGDGYGNIKFGKDEYDMGIGYDSVESIYKAAMDQGFNNAAEFIASDALSDDQKRDIISQGMYGDMLGEAKYENLDFGQQEIIDDIFNNFVDGMSEYEKLLTDNELQNASLIKQNVMNSLSDELIYQQSDYKDFIVDQTGTQENYNAEKEKALKTYSNMTDEEVQTAFQDALGDNYIYEDGKVYNKNEDGTKGEENTNLSDLSTDEMKDYLASGDAIQALEEQGLLLAQKISSITDNLNEEDKKIVDAFMNGNTSQLTKEEIANLQNIGSFDDLVTMYPELGRLKNILGEDAVNALFGDFTTSIEKWEPPKIDLEKTASEFNDVQKILSETKFGDTISAEDFAKLGDGAENYFTRMADGTYKMTGDAEAFYALVSSGAKEKMFTDLTNSIDYGAKLIQDKEAADAAMGNMDIDTIGQNQYKIDTNSYVRDNVESQINFALEMGTITQDEADTWLSDLEDGTFDSGADALEIIANKAGEAAIKYQELNTEIDNNNASLEQTIQTAYTSASSLSELDSIHSQMKATLGEESDLSYFYAQGLLNIASAYSNAADEAAALQEAMANGQDTATAEDELKAAINIGEAAQTHDLDAEVLETQAKYYQELYPKMELTAEQAANLAIQQQRMEKGLTNLSKSWKDYSKILDKNERETSEYAKTVTELTDIIGDLVGANEDLELSSEFFDEASGNLELLGKAAEGDIDAINALGIAVSKDLVKSMDFDFNGLGAIDKTIVNENDLKTIQTITEQGFNTAKQTVLSGLEGLQQAVANGSVQMGDTLGSIGGVSASSWASSLNEMAMATSMSVEEMNSMLNSMGVQANVTTKDVQTTTKVPEYTTETIIDDRDEVTKMPTKTRTVTYQTGSKTVTSVTPVAQIDMGEGGSGPNIKYAGATNSGGGGASGGGGGGGGASKPEKATKKSDVVERYKEIDAKINDSTRVMDKASKAADRLWGPERIAKMREVNNQLKANIELLKDKRAEAEYHLANDKIDLITAVQENAGIALTEDAFDDKGNFVQYDEILGGLYNELREQETIAMSKVGDIEGVTQTDIDKAATAVEAIQKRIDAVKEAISTYDDTNSIVKDLSDQIDEEIYNWQDANYELLNLELEVQVQINEKDLELIEYFMDKIEDDIYGMVESYSQLNSDKINEYTDNLKLQQNHVDTLTREYEAGNISQQAYKEGLAESQSAIISNLQSLQEQKEAMQDYYGNVLDMAIEEITIYTEEMENLNSVLDHYSNILELVGKQNDYTSKNKILTSQANNLRNEMQVQSKLYEEESQKVEYWAAKMASAVEGTEEYETFKKNWIAAKDAANEAQDAMLSKTQEWAEMMKLIVENELAELAEIMEKSLTGGSSFDALLESMERRNSLQEEYLTSTNKIYETNKLMRSAQQEIDKTTNTIAKRKLQGFIKETSQLQNQKELSQYELNIQQAKYELLLAEIAAEEARNAKTTVRLQRDSEGNMSYVYTADSDAVSNAQQELEDKQNALYNLGLEGANDYSQKYAEIMQEAQDAMVELMEQKMAGEIASEEEFGRRKLEIQEYYGAKLQQYSGLYQVALGTDSRVIADAWSTDFSDMIGKTEEWNKTVNTYFTKTTDSLKVWSEVSKTALEQSGLNDMETALGNIDEKSNALFTTLLGEDGESGVVGAMMNMVSAAGEISLSQIEVQRSIGETIKTYENLLKIVTQTYTALTTPIEPTIANPPETAPTSEGDNTYEPPQAAHTSGDMGEYKPASGGGSSSGGGGGGGIGYDNQGYSAIEVKEAQRYVGVSRDGKWGPASQRAAQNKYGTDRISKVLARGRMDAQKNNNNNRAVSLFENELTTLDTGGYTGAWGSYGKLAVLHEKELVLNKHDTENFLSSMSILEKILQVIDLQSINSRMSNLMTPTFGSNSSVIEQEVHIEAHFPNVNNHSEIEEAFSNLINTASQYANRKK